MARSRRASKGRRSSRHSVEGSSASGAVRGTDKSPTPLAPAVAPAAAQASDSGLEASSEALAIRNRTMHARPDGRSGSEAAKLRTSLFEQQGKVDPNPEPTRRGRRQRGRQQGQGGLNALDGLGDGLGVDGSGLAELAAAGGKGGHMVLGGRMPGMSSSDDDYDADYEAMSSPDATPTAAKLRVGRGAGSVQVPSKPGGSSFKAPDLSALPTTIDSGDEVQEDAKLDGSDASGYEDDEFEKDTTTAAGAGTSTWKPTGAAEGTAVSAHMVAKIAAQGGDEYTVDDEYVIDDSDGDSVLST